MGCVGSRVDIEANGRQYHLKQIIASGGFSQIFCAEDLESQERVAIKKITCHSSAEINRTHREIDFHCKYGGWRNTNKDDCKNLNLKHLMPIIGVSKKKLDSSVIIFSLVFPLCKLGSVQDELSARRLKKDYISQQRVLSLFRQVCLALEVLHNSNPPIAHRDLKPANLMLQNKDHILLTDFGSATECPIHISDAKQSRSMLDEAAEMCTMPYRAPELFTCETGTIVDQSVDIWSLGCVLYAFCYFCSPYDEVHERGDSVALAAQSARLTFDSEAPIEENVNLLISSLIKFNPNERPKISEILYQL